MSALDDILIGVRADLAERQSRMSLAEVKEAAAKAAPARDAVSALRRDEVCVIAEVKRKSPSVSNIAQIDDPAELARQYEKGGAHAVSVLTEQRHFAGSLEDLIAVRRAVDVPILRKDFIVSAYQLWEARAAGADMVLLIVAALDIDALVSLHERAESIGLSVLVEVHDESEVVAAVAAGARIIGVNARDLRTLKVDRGQFARVAPNLPANVIRVAESGVRDEHDLIAYARAGADAVLVGQGVLQSASPERAVHDLVAAGSHPALRRRA